MKCVTNLGVLADLVLGDKFSSFLPTPLTGSPRAQLSLIYNLILVEIILLVGDIALKILQKSVEIRLLLC